MRADFVHCPKCRKVVAKVCENDHGCGEEEAPVQRLGGVKKPSRSKKK